MITPPVRMSLTHLKARARSTSASTAAQTSTSSPARTPGAAIQPELLDHIFEKGVSSKGENRGTGLFLVHELMEEYGGTIDIDTEPGEGTCFTLTFTRKETESNV